MRTVMIIAAMLLAVAAGVAGASVVVAGEPPDPPPTGGAQPGTLNVGGATADPDGGPVWAVRSYDSASGSRCIAVGRTDGNAFGPVDASGAIRDVDPELAASCADPDAEPVQVALSLHADTAGDGPRSVFFGVAGPSVVSVTVTGPLGTETVALGVERSFVIVAEGIFDGGDWSAVATLSDGTTRNVTS